MIDIGERSGLCDLFHIWEANGYKEPIIRESLNPDRITLTLQIEIDSNERNSDRYERKNDKNLSKNETLVLNALHSDNCLSAAQVSLKTGLSISTVNHIYKNLKTKEYIARNGSTRGRWEILK